jgi:hypothetical protein
MSVDGFGESVTLQISPFKKSCRGSIVSNGRYAIIQCKEAQTSSVACMMPYQESAAVGPSISKSVGSVLDGIHNAQPSKVGGVIISKELEHLWNVNIIQS